MTVPTPRAEGLREAIASAVDWLDHDDPYAAEYALRAALAASDTAPGLDVERLARAMEEVDGPGFWAPDHAIDQARKVAAEYARLASPDPTETPTE